MYQVMSSTLQREEKFFIDTASGNRLRVDSMRGAGKAEDAHKHFPESYITKYTSDVHVFVPGSWTHVLNVEMCLI